jgi:hypothetical protein
VNELLSAFFVVGRRIKYSLHGIFEPKGSTAEAKRQSSRKFPRYAALKLVVFKKYSYIKKSP